MKLYKLQNDTYIAQICSICELFCKEDTYLEDYRAYKKKVLRFSGSGADRFALTMLPAVLKCLSDWIEVATTPSNFRAILARWEHNWWCDLYHSNGFSFNSITGPHLYWLTCVSTIYLMAQKVKKQDLQRRHHRKAFPRHISSFLGRWRVIRLITQFSRVVAFWCSNWSWLYRQLITTSFVMPLTIASCSFVVIVYPVRRYIASWL